MCGYLDGVGLVDMFTVFHSFTDNLYYVFHWA